MVALRERLDLAGRGQGGLVLIAGEPGIGKTRLLTEFADFARAAGWLVLSGRAYDMEGMPPYLPFVEAIGEQVRTSSDEHLLAVVEDAPAVASLIPEIRRRFPAAGPGQPLSPDAERYRFFEGVCGFLLQAARSSEARGLLLCLDDLHWADRASLLLLLHLARKLQHACLLVAGTYRTDEGDASRPLPDMLAETAKDRLDERITLSPFSPAESTALIEGISGGRAAAAVSQALHNQTEGNPFFIEEVVRQLRSEGRNLADPQAAAGGWTTPAGVREVIRRRLSRLTMEAQRLLQACAVLGAGVVPDLVKAVTEVSDDALVSGFEELSGAGMLREEETAYTFAHPLIRQVVYEALSLARRQHLHARAAEALESRKVADNPSASAAIGHHWRLGGRAERAIEHLLQAGETAISLTAWEDVARHWEAALECMDQAGEAPGRRAHLQEALGDLCFLSSFEVRDAIGRYESAIELYERVGDRGAAARAHSKAGRSLAYPTVGFDFSRAVDHLHAAEVVLGAGPDSFDLGEVYFALAHAQTHALRSEPAEVLTAIRRLRAIAERLDNAFLRIAATSLEGHFLGLEGHLAEGLALEEAACDDAVALEQSGVNLWPERWQDLLSETPRETDDTLGKTPLSIHVGRFFPRVLMPYTANCCGLQSLEMGDPVRARAQHEKIRDPVGRFMSPFLLYDLFSSGEVTTIRRLLDPATRGFTTLNPEVLTLGPLVMAWCEGRWSEIDTGYKARMERYRNMHSNSLLTFASRWLVRLYRNIGDAERALAAIEECLPLIEASRAVKFELPLRAELALILSESGRLADAESNLARCAEILAQGEDWRGLRGRVALAEAVQAAAQRRTDEAGAHFEEAIEGFRSFTLPWDEAEAYEVWARSCARFHRASGRRAFVAEKLASARAVYERIGAGQPWLDRLDSQERRLLPAPGQGAGSGLPDGLTEREVDVLRLLAGGRSNREVAAGLVLSVRTVERHITNIYAKIGARGKADATAYALRHSLS